MRTVRKTLLGFEDINLLQQDNDDDDYDNVKKDVSD